MPRESETVEFLSIRTVMLPALVIYGCLVEPLAGFGGLPCLWKLCFGIECPGCGLSRADSLLMRGHVRDALALNWLIVPVWSAAFHSFVSHAYAIIKLKRTTHG